MTRHVIVIVLLVGSAVAAQSLGEVARREAERRQTVPAGKTYTNADLGPADAQPAVEPAPPPAPPAAPADESSEPKKVVNKQLNGTTVEEDPKTGTANIVAPPARNKRDEKYWRDRAHDVNTRLAKAKADIAAMQARLQALETAPALGNASEHALTAKALAKLQIELGSANDDFARMKTAAEFARIPPEWTQ